MIINTQTVKFIGFLNMLAEKSENGIRPFSTAIVQDKDGLLYDDKNPIEIRDIDEDSSYPLVVDSIIDEEHHDIISTSQDCALPRDTVQGQGRDTGRVPRSSTPTTCCGQSHPNTAIPREDLTLQPVLSTGEHLHNQL